MRKKIDCLFVCCFIILMYRHHAIVTSHVSRYICTLKWNCLGPIRNSWIKQLNSPNYHLLFFIDLVYQLNQVDFLFCSSKTTKIATVFHSDKLIDITLSISICILKKKLCSYRKYDYFVTMTTWQCDHNLFLSVMSRLKYAQRDSTWENIVSHTQYRKGNWNHTLHTRHVFQMYRKYNIDLNIRALEVRWTFYRVFSICYLSSSYGRNARNQRCYF